MTDSRGIVAFITLITLGPANPAHAQQSVAMPVRLSGAAWQDAVAEVAAELGVSYVIAPGLDHRVRHQGVRLQTEHLTGEQVLRWLARLADVAAIPVGDHYLFGIPNEWPALWQAHWQRRCGPAAVGDPKLSRRASIEWADQPLSAAIAEIRRTYGLDVIVDPAIFEQQQLLTLSARDVRGEELIGQMATELGAGHAFADGALMVGRPAWVSRCLGQPAGGSEPTPPPRQEGSGLAAPIEAAQAHSAGGRKPQVAWWNDWVQVTPIAGSPVDSLRPIRHKTDSGAVWQAAAGTSSPPGGWTAEASGRIGEVLEGLALLGKLQWERSADDGSSGIVYIRVQSWTGDDRR